MMGDSVRARRWSALLALPCSALLRCTVASNFDVQQCEVDADCRLAAEGIQRCVTSRCVAGCENNHACASFDPRTPICPSRGEQCASLTSEDGSCYLSSAYDDATMGTLRGSEMTILGAFTPTLQSATWLTLDLAASEVNQARGLPGGEGLAPVLVVLCDGSSTKLASSMDHLLDQLRVPALIGSVEDVGLQILAQRPAQQEKALLLGPRAVGTQTEAEALTWYLGGRLADVVDAYPALVRGVSQLVEQRSGIAGALRIASLESEAVEDAALAAQITAVIDLDGKDARYLFREDRFRRFVLSDDLPDERARTIDRLISYAPDLILVSIGGAFSAPMPEARLAVIGALEEQAAAGNWSPLYVFGPRAADDSALLRLAEAGSSFRERALGLSADRAPEPRVAGALIERFNAAFPEALRQGGLGPQLLVYDALYYLVYATLAAPASVRSPEAILDGLSRVVANDQACIDVGPDGVAAVLQAIRHGEPVQLCGTTGPARFATGQARPAQARLFCWTSAPGEQLAGTGIETIESPFASPAAQALPPCARAFLPEALP